MSIEQENEWIEWNGGECPVEAGMHVDIRIRNGETNKCWMAGDWAGGAYDWWKHESPSRDYDIIAYRIVRES